MADKEAPADRARLDTPRLGLSRPEAARYVGISPTKFDQLVADGRMPQPKQIDGRLVWDIRCLTLAFDELPARAGPAHVTAGDSFADYGKGNDWDDYLTSAGRSRK